MGSKLNGRARGRRVLEPRVLFDASALATAVAADTSADTSATAQSSESLLDSLASLPPTPVTQPRDIYVVDSAVEGAATFADSLRQDGRTVVLLDATQDGINQLYNALAGYGQVDSIKIFSHGADGMFRLGSTLVDKFTVQTRSAEFTALGSLLSADGDILLYGCDIAKTQTGVDFVQALSSATGADIAASTDTTGATGNWTLEKTTGPVDATVSGVVSSYMGDLNLDGVFVATQTGAASAQFGWAMAADGNFVAAGNVGQGSVTVWYVTGTTRTQYTLAKPDASWSTDFGRGVALDGSTLVVADPTNDKIAVFQYAPAEALDPTYGVWHLRTTFTTAGGTALTGLGYSTQNAGYGEANYMSVDGNHIVIGLPDEGSGAGAGRFAWFADTSSGGNWSTSASGILDEPADGQSTDTGSEGSTNSFGASVSVAKDYLVVGNPTMDTNGNNDWSWGDNGQRQGRVFVYSWTAGSTSAPTRYTNGSWSFLTGQTDIDNLNGGDGADSARFGSVVALDYYNGRYTLAVGAPGEGRGEIYIYQSSSGDIGTFGAATNLYNQTDGANTSERFGSAIAVSQGKIIAGAYLEDTANTSRTVMYYEDTDGIWGNGLDLNGGNTGTSGSMASGAILYRNFTPSEAGVGNNLRFGWSVGFANGNLLVVGSPSYSSSAGAVSFFYVRTPVAADDTFTVSEDTLGTVTYDVIKSAAAGGTAGKDILGTETVSSIDGAIVTNSQTGLGTFGWNTSTENLTYSLGSAASVYDYLSVGDTATVTVKYSLTDPDKPFTSQATVTFTINGVNDAPVVNLGLSNVSVPKSIDGVATTGSIAISNQAFYDVDIHDTLTYSLLSATSIGSTAVNINGVPTTGPGVGNNGVTGTAAPGGVFTLTGSTINYNMTNATAYSQYKLTVQASDGHGGTVTYDMIFTVARTDVTPTVTGSAISFSTAEDATFSQNLAGNFSDGDSSWVDPNTGDSLDFTEKLTYSIVSQSGNGAAWLTVSSTGTLSGVPANENVGAYSVTVRATDIFGKYVDKAVSITVTNTNDAPVVTSTIARQTAVIGSGSSPFTFSIADNTPTPDTDTYFSDPDNAANVIAVPNPVNNISYRAYVMNGTPAGVEITSSAAGTGLGQWLRFNGNPDPATGLVQFTGNATSSGNPVDPLGTILQIQLVATDQFGASTSTTFEIGEFPADGSATVLDPNVASSGAVTAGARLGTSVAISPDGVWAVFGDPGYNTGDGQIRIYKNTAGTWAYVTQFTGVAASDSRFGAAVDISDVNAGGTAGYYRIVVGAPRETALAGKVYFYQYNGTTWSAYSTATSTAPAGDNNTGDNFGASVAIDAAGNNVLVGATGDDAVTTNSGAAYYFGFGTAATAGAKHLPTTDSGESAAALFNENYGISVSLDGNMAVVGASRDDHDGYTDAGSVYVYATSNFAQYSKLTKTPLTVASNDQFGRSVDVDTFTSTNGGVILAVGAVGDDKLAVDAGAVYVYRSDTMTADIADANGSLQTLVQQAVVTAYDGKTLQNFGVDVAIDVAGDTSSGAIRMVVGSDVNDSNPGAVYVYRYWASGSGGVFPGGWVGQRYLASNSTATGVNVTTDASNMFGSAVEIGGTNIVAGASNADRTTSPAAGHIYAFSISASKVETQPLSGVFTKTLVGEAGPQIVGIDTIAFDSGGFAGAQSFEEWLRRHAAVRPVDTSAVAVAPTMERAIAEVSTISDEALLYAMRTEAVMGGKVAMAAAAADVNAAAPAIPGDASQPACDAQAEQCAEPASDAAAAPDDKTTSAVRTYLRLSEQLAVMQGMRNVAARNLVSSLDTLVG